MTLMIRSTARVRLCELRKLASRYPLPTAVIVSLAAGAGIAMALADFSAQLTPAQIEVVRAFVIRTNSAEVGDRYNRALRDDGTLTVREAERIVEAAKGQEPTYGLATGLAGQDGRGTQ